MKVLLTGSTGFLGSHLERQLTVNGHEVFGVSRGPGAAFDWSDESLRRGVKTTEAIIHLAGENLFARRWSAAQKERLRSSRIETTARLAHLAAEVGSQVLISASAVGYYGPRGSEPIDESAGPGEDFLARLCRDWEAAAAPARAAGVRVASVRCGVILGVGGGALARMLLPFRLGLGGQVGNGRQVFPWIHVADLCALFRFLLEHEEVSGPFNGTAPEPVTMREFARALGRVLHRPAIFPAPAFALRLALGEVASVLLTGQKALPTAAISAGFAFQHPRLESALAALLGRPHL